MEIKEIYNAQSDAVKDLYDALDKYYKSFVTKAQHIIAVKERLLYGEPKKFPKRKLLKKLRRKGTPWVRPMLGPNDDPKLTRKHLALIEKLGGISKLNEYDMDSLKDETRYWGDLIRNLHTQGFQKHMEYLEDRGISFKIEDKGVTAFNDANK
jgi:hypothetical protein